MLFSILFKHPITLLFSAFFCGAAVAASTIDEEFSLPSTDQRVTLRGEITLPKKPTLKKLIPVIIVNGTTGTRDGTLYVSYKLPAPVRASYFMLRTIARALAQQGFAVIRYDSRGITSQLNCERLRKSSRVSPQQYLHDTRCYDKVAALTTTYDSKKEDLSEVYAMVQRDKRFNGEQIVMMPISEGSIHTARLIAERTIKPAGIVFWGAPVVSPKALIQWQSRDSYYEQLLASFRQQEDFRIFPDGLFSKSVDFDLPENKDAGIGIIGYRGIPSLDMLKMILDHHYQLEVNSILAQAPATQRLRDHGLGHDIAVASLVSWQDLMQDDTSLTVRLKHYSGKMSFLYGKKDRLVPVDNQLLLLQPILNARIRTTIFPDLSHSLKTYDNHFQSSVLYKIVEQVHWISNKQ